MGCLFSRYQAPAEAGGGGGGGGGGGTAASAAVHNHQQHHHGSYRQLQRLPALLPYSGAVPRYTLAQIKSATGDFRELIGEGGFGSVYKGAFLDPTTGKPFEVAVKKLSQASEQGPEEFLTEVITMGQLRHPRILLLVGCCTDQCRALIYEYIPLGDVAMHLRRVADGEAEFPLAARLRVARGCAEALMVIHRLGFIHRDFKATNVLLKEGLEPVLADFGIARTIEDWNTHVTTRIVGTAAYLDPVYHETGQLSAACDVFSFGVFLLEVFSGVLSGGNAFSQLRRFILQPDHPSITAMHEHDLIDARLRAVNSQNANGNGDGSGGGGLSERDVRRLVAIVRACMAQKWADRPTMEVVFKSLGRLGSSSTRTSDSSSGGGQSWEREESLRK